MLEGLGVRDWRGLGEFQNGKGEGVFPILDGASSWDKGPVSKGLRRGGVLAFDVSYGRAVVNRDGKLRRIQSATASRSENGSPPWKKTRS